MRCAALHVIRLLCKSDWFSWQPGKKDCRNWEVYTAHPSCPEEKSILFSMWWILSYRYGWLFFTPDQGQGPIIQSPLKYTGKSVSNLQKKEQQIPSFTVSFSRVCQNFPLWVIVEHLDIYFWGRNKPMHALFCSQIFFSLSGLIFWTK